MKKMINGIKNIINILLCIINTKKQVLKMSRYKNWFRYNNGDDTFTIMCGCGITFNQKAHPKQHVTYICGRCDQEIGEQIMKCPVDCWCWFKDEEDQEDCILNKGE